MRDKVHKAVARPGGSANRRRLVGLFMGVVRHSSEVKASRERAFAYVNDHRHVQDWMFGIKKFKPVSDTTYGLGATFDVVMSAGPKTIKSTMKITEFVENEMVRLESVKGFSAATVWRFEDAATGTNVNIEMSYDLPGGIAGRALGAVIEPVIGQAVRQTDSALKAQLDKPA